MKMMFSKHKSPKIMTNLITLLKWRTCFIIHTNSIAFFFLNGIEREKTVHSCLFNNSLTYKVRGGILFGEKSYKPAIKRYFTLKDYICN